MILILGGYGNFGKRIARALTKANIPIVIAGRNQNKALALQQLLQKSHPEAQIETAIFNVNEELAQQLDQLSSKMVINTVGPFQNADYHVAEACITAGVHYIDLADGRDFVVNIPRLNEKAKSANVAVIGGASTVPALSSAVIEKYRSEFLQIYSLTYGISPGQKAERGLATTKGILTYVGKPLNATKRNGKKRYGWQDVYRQQYPMLGLRWMANCDVPDLDLLPRKYAIDQIKFSAGMENGALHLGIWFVSWMVRLGLPLNLPKYASPLLKISHLFDWLGSDDGGMHMIIEGVDAHNKPKRIEWYIVAKNGDGPQIPTIPTIILAKKLWADELAFRGAAACVAMVSLDEYLAELEEFDIKTYQMQNGR